MLKSISLIVLAGVFSFTSCGQNNTTPPPAKTTQTTTSAKTSTAATKTAPVNTKVPATISKNTAVKKTTTTLQKTGTVKTTAPQTQTTTVKTVTNTTTQTKTATPVVVQKTEPAVIVAKPETQTQTQPAKVQTNTTTTETQTQPTGKLNTGTGGNTQQQTNTNTGIGDKIINGGTGGNGIINTITEGDASSAIKEALMKGVQVGVDKVSITDGYFGNSLIKIPFPQQVKQVESALRKVGMGSLIDNMVLSMNRAAESAAKQAGPIFLNGIKQMTVTDAVNIVSNKQPDAATQFLKRTTSESLVSSFKPSIKTAMDKTLATKYWSEITTYYNKIPLVSPINTDLPDYVTRKAIDGLFYMVAQEEAKIRKDPAGQASDIIKDVFGKVKF